MRGRVLFQGAGRPSVALALRFAPYLLLLAAFVHAAAAGWRRWGDLFVDTGRELDLPRRLANGERLYADLRWYYGPLAPHLNAALYWAFGVHSDVLAWAGVLSAAVLAVVLVALVEPLAGRWVGSAVGVAFVYLCAFKHLSNLAIFNFAMPYTYAATYGMVAAAGSLLGLVRHVATRSVSSLAASVALFVLAALAKAEVLLPVLVAHGAAVAVLAVTGRLRRLHAIAYAAGLAVIASTYIGLAYAVGPGLWTENLGALANQGSRHFISWTSGTADVVASLRTVALSCALLGLGLVIAGSAARLADARPGWRLAVSAAAFAALFGVQAAWGIELGFQALPVLLLTALAGLALRWRRGGMDAAWQQTALVVVFALGALARIVLRAQPDHYGFYLLPVGLAALGVVVARLLPVLLGAGDAGRLVLRVSAVAMLLGASVAAFRVSQEHWAWYDTELITPRGHFIVQAGDAPLVGLIGRLGTLPPTTRLVAVPQGAAVPFLAGLETGEPVFSYLPMEVSTAEADRALAARWAAHPPDLILRVLLDQSEFGVRGFGQGYAEAANGFIASGYEPLGQVGPDALLLRRTRRAP